LVDVSDDDPVALFVLDHEWAAQQGGDAKPAAAAETEDEYD
jgi:hypothetical protein